MNLIKSLLIATLVQLMIASIAVAGEYDWLKNLNIRAEADSSGFRMKLATRFRMGTSEINAVVNNVDKASDAYMVLRLGEMTHRPLNEVLHVYHSNNKTGWGRMAKQLGIKPGSKAFHALKRGQDLYVENSGNSHKKHAMRSNGKDNGKGHKNHKAKGKKF